MSSWPLVLPAANTAILGPWVDVSVDSFRSLGLLVITCQMKGLMLVTLTMTMVVTSVYLVYLVDSKWISKCCFFHGLATWTYKKNRWANECVLRLLPCTQKSLICFSVFSSFNFQCKHEISNRKVFRNVLIHSYCHHPPSQYIQCLFITFPMHHLTSLTTMTHHC